MKIQELYKTNVAFVKGASYYLSSVCLTLYGVISWNGQKHFKNFAANYSLKGSSRKYSKMQAFFGAAISV